MAPIKKASDAVHWYMSELSSRVVAESGIPSDRHHLGKLTLQSLKDAPEFVMQVDAATGQSEKYQSVLERSVRCAECFKELGLTKGDVIVLMAPNSLDLAIPLYAALYLGVIVATIDSESSVGDLENLFKKNRGKIIFCRGERASYVKEALKNIDLDAKVVAFDKGGDTTLFSEFLEQYGGNTDVATFKASDFDPAETIALLLSTTGTTGIPKTSCSTHKNFALSLLYLWTSFDQFPTPTRLVLVAAPLDWITTCFNFLGSPILRYTRLQSSQIIKPGDLVDIINKYKPTYMITSPTILMTLIRGSRGKCDLTSFEFMLLAGSAVPQQLLDDLKVIAPGLRAYACYGMTEINSVAFFDENPALGSLGRPVGLFEYRLVDIKTKEDITEPHVDGELWMRGPTLCKGYFNDPETTAAAFEDGWLKTGDIMHRDENYFFYFVERVKVLLIYRDIQISPVELESVIRQHPGVLDVAVTGVPDLECGDLPVACVVPRPGHHLTAQEIKDLVKNTLSDKKQLHGGVVFLSELPLTASTKLHRRKLKEMVLTMDRQ